VKPLRVVVNFVLIVVLGSTALAVSAALLVPAGRTFKSAVSPLRGLDVRLKAQPQRSYVFDRNGNLMTTLYTDDRAPVRLKDVPQQLIDAVLAIEDRKFYEHNGVDLEGAIRAFRRNADSGEIQQGGSTITEQLIKNTIDKGQERTFKTKAREAITAIRLEHEITKNQILEDYLNLVPFGHNAFGIEVAAERYFNKTMFGLTLPECAMLAGLVQAPSALDPIAHPAAAATRRGLVLDAMVKTQKITQAQADAANSAPLPTKLFYPEPSLRSYYIDALIGSLLEPGSRSPADPARAVGKTRAVRIARVYRGGLRIYTNYDPAMQYLANLAISNVIPKNQDQFTGALVSIDNSNGAVRAVAFGRGYDASQFDPAVDGPGRQAGSSFKGITLATALASGYSPDDRVDGYSLHWRLGPGDGSDAYYNLSGDCHGGDPTLTEAIAISDNCAFVRTELSLGPAHYGQDGVQRVINMAARMGINTANFLPVVSTTLGTNGVHPLEMAQAYSVIAAGGVLHPATFVSKIVGPTGKVMYETPKQGTRLFTREVARSETQMLTEVLKNGTAAGLTIDRPAAGKTGTTDENQDAWFIGYTPQLTTAVWMGDPNAETPMTSVGGISVFGATYPADIWAAFMKAALRDVPVVDFTPPDEKLWPDPGQIDEYGRTVTHYRHYDYTPPPDTTPATQPAPLPTAPPIVAPTTSPPATVPPTPRTTPGTTPHKPSKGP
jgi:membrane peptidoglycan carboxypeptidase